MADQSGDYPKHDEPPRYSMMELQIRKLKLSLENWREIVLYGKRIFIWEEQWHPLAIITTTTVIFMILWLLDPSILLVFSVLGLSITVCDYMISSIASSLFKNEKWTARKDQEFEEICTNVVLFKAKLELAWGYYCRLKITNRKMYFILTITGLSLLAWIGCTFNNLFLSYILVTILMLLPGLDHNGMLSKWTDLVNKLLLDIMKPKNEKED